MFVQAAQREGKTLSVWLQELGTKRAAQLGVEP